MAYQFIGEVIDYFIQPLTFRLYVLNLPTSVAPRFINLLAVGPICTTVVQCYYSPGQLHVDNKLKIIILIILRLNALSISSGQETVSLSDLSHLQRKLS